MKYTNTNTNQTAAVTRAQDPSVQLTQLDWLGNLSNLLDAASDCFATHPGGFYSDNLRRRNLAPEGEHKLPSPCSVMWDSNQWKIHFLLEDFIEVINGLFADGRLNAIRQQDVFTPGSGIANDFEVYLAGDFKIQRIEPDLGGPVYYKISYTPATMSSIRMFTLVEQEDPGNIRAVLARYGIQLPEEEE